jgi:hypothetical protein
MAEYLDPKERWPTHSRPEARAALREAAAAGWHLRKSAGHIFGTIKCPAIGQSGACTMPVYSTSGPADGSETAKAIRKVLRNCPHQTGTPPEEADAVRALTDEEIERQVERLLRAVDGLNRRSQANVGVEDAIDRDDITALDEQHQCLIVGDNDAQIAWAQLGRPLEPWPPAVAIEALLTEVERLIAAVDDPERAERLAALVENVRA